MEGGGETRLKEIVETQTNYHLKLFGKSFSRAIIKFHGDLKIKGHFANGLASLRL